MFPFKPNRRYTTIALYAGAVIAAAILFGVLLFNLRAVADGISALTRSLSPILYALVFAYLLSPLVLRFEHLFLKIRRKSKVVSDTDDPSPSIRLTAISVAFLLIFLLIYIFVRFILPLLIGDGEMLMSRLLTVAERVTALINSVGGAFGFTISAEQLYSFLGGFTTTIADLIFSIGRGFTLTLFNTGVGICLSVGILFHRRALVAAFRHAGAAVFSLRVFRYLERLSFYANRIFGKYLIGKIVECTIVGVLYLIVLPLLGVPYPFLITVIMTVTNFVPIIGAILGGIPSAVLILTGDNPFLVVWFIIIVLTVEQIDGNIIFPKVIGSIIDLRAVWIMVAVALFGGFFGIIGMFLSPPLFAVIYMLIRDFANHRLKTKGLPTESEFYVDKFSSTATPRKHLFSHKKKHASHEDHDEGGDNA